MAEGERQPPPPAAPGPQQRPGPARPGPARPRRTLAAARARHRAAPRAEPSRVVGTERSGKRGPGRVPSNFTLSVRMG